MCPQHERNSCYTQFLPTQVQQVDNNPYSLNFGGLSPAYNTNTWKKFCDPSASYWYPDGSRHDLSYIRDLIDNNAYGWGFGSDPNPCVACHNPHYDQRNHPVIVTGTLNTAIRRPSHYRSSDSGDFLWGDDEEERMDVYAATFTYGVYLPPYFGDTTSGKFEPTGTATNYAGDRTPDYVTFCLDCHQYSVDSKYGPLQAIDWGGTGNHGYAAHGGADGTLTDINNIDEPYKQVNSVNYVLSCLDCHEPHGSPNVTLIRKRVNASTVSSITTISQVGCEDRENQNKKMANLCNRCHNDDNQIGSGCTSNRWYKIHHEDPTDTGCNTDSPYYYRTWCGSCHLESGMGNWNCNNEDVTPISCNCCHYHGSIVDNCYYEPTTRRTF